MATRSHEDSGAAQHGAALQAAYDVVVVGGGAAGLSGALALGRARRSVLVVDAGDPRNAPAGQVHNYLGREGTPPAELLAIGRREVAAYGVEVVTGTVTSASQTAQTDPGVVDPAFEVTLAGGETVRARRVLVTTGLVDELPDLPGLAERWGRDVLHCPYCHGYEVRDQTIGVLARSPFSVHQALLFRQWSDDVTLLLDGGPPPADEAAEQLAARGIRVVDTAVTAVEVTDDRLTGVRLATGDAVRLDALVVAPQFVARADVLSSLGIESTEVEMGGHAFGRQVTADAQGATAVPGVYVAGNVADVRAQVISAAAAGLSCGAFINADLVMADTAQAVAAHRAERAAAHS